MDVETSKRVTAAGFEGCCGLVMVDHINTVSDVDKQRSDRCKDGSLWWSHQTTARAGAHLEHLLDGGCHNFHPLLGAGVDSDPVHLVHQALPLYQTATHTKQGIIIWCRQAGNPSSACMGWLAVSIVGHV